MRSLLLTLAIATMAACGGDDAAVPDASGVDASTTLCTGEAYDSCQDTTSWTDCLDGMECRVFGTAGITICTPTCDVNNPCPDQDGQPITCNMMGKCRGTAANACELP